MSTESRPVVEAAMLCSSGDMSSRRRLPMSSSSSTDHRLVAPFPTRSTPLDWRSLPRIAASDLPHHTRRSPPDMTTPHCLPEELSAVAQPAEVRPSGRRHRRDRRETYEGYPSVVNQSFAFDRPSRPFPTTSPRRPLSFAQPAQPTPAAEPLRPLPRPPRTAPAAAATVPPGTASTRHSHSVTASRPASSVAINEISTGTSVPGATSSQVAVLVEEPIPSVTVPALNTLPKEPVMVYPTDEIVTYALPKITLSRKPELVPTGPHKTADVDEYEEDLSCPICMNVMVGPCLLSPCGHALCGPCIVPWLETRASTGESINCPVCRERVSKRHPLVQSRNLEAVIQRWVKHRIAEGNWEGKADWTERQELWTVHKQYNPELLSPELFNRRIAPPDSPNPSLIVFPPSENSLTRRAGNSGNGDGGWPTLFDFPFPDHSGSHFAASLSFGVPAYDPFQQFTDIHSRFDAIRNHILQDIARNRQ